MLRITAQDTSANVTLRLEGNLAGVWVTEFCSAWRTARRDLAGRTLLIDLTAVGRVDQAGEYLLALIHRSGAKLGGSGVVTSELIRTIETEWPLQPEPAPTRKA